MSPPGDSKSGGGMRMNSVTTVMAFSVSAFFVLFVFVRLLCARLHLRIDRAAARAGNAFVVRTYDVERGLEPSVVTSFPTVKLDDDDGTRRSPGQEVSQCTVCLEEYAAKDVVRVLPACGHGFHAACIDAWLRQHPTCPVCRAATKNHDRAAPLEYSLAVAAARAPASRSQQVPESSSGVITASPPQTDAGTDDRLEIVSEEPAGSSVEQSADAVTDDRLEIVSEEPAGSSVEQSADAVTDDRLGIVSEEPAGSSVEQSADAVTDDRLGIVSEELAGSSVEQQQSAGVVDGSGCGETGRQSASERC